jgi:membrane fusion protein (multidrug efflux system)
MIVRSLAGAIILAAAVSLPAFAQAPAPATPRVGTVAAELRPVTPAKEFVGRIEAIERVEIRARVTGYLDAVLFKEGDRVKEGADLYRIEQAPFQSAVQQAQGARLRAQATLANAALQLKRAEELVKTSATSVAERDKRLADQQTAQGDVLTADANLKTAQINLAYTDITAPIAGIVGRTAVTRGNVVTPNSGVLTTIVSQDPMYVVFPVSQREFLQIEGERRRAADHPVSVSLRFSDGSTYGQTGRIDFVDISVDRGTDTVTVRASMPNPDGVLIDGQLVRVAVAGDTPEQKVLIPQAALLTDQQGTYVFVVEDGKAAIRRLKLGTDVGPNVVVESGLEAGTQVVMEGVEALRPGMPVTAVPAAPTPTRS